MRPPRCAQSAFDFVAGSATISPSTPAGPLPQGTLSLGGFFFARKGTLLANGSESPLGKEAGNGG